MCQEKSDEERTKEMLESIEKVYGFVPLVNEILSERPDLFIPSVELGRSVFYGKCEMNRKTRHLVALAAAAGVGAEHCMGVQIKLALKAGATRNEILEAMQIASVVSMTHTQSVAFRKFRELVPKE